MHTFRTSKPIGVVDAIVSAVSGLSRDSDLCTKSMFSHCSAPVTNSPFQDSHHCFLIKFDVRNPNAEPQAEKARRLGIRAAAEIKKPAAFASIQQSDWLRAEENGRDVCASLMTAQF